MKNKIYLLYQKTFSFIRENEDDFMDENLNSLVSSFWDFEEGIHFKKEKDYYNAMTCFNYAFSDIPDIEEAAELRNALEKIGLKMENKIKAMS